LLGEEITVGCRKLHKELLGVCSLNIILLIKSKRNMGRACGTYRGEETCMDRCLVRKPEGNSPLGKSGYRWEGNIKMVKKGKV
jgi:hypothetical protein